MAAASCRLRQKANAPKFRTYIATEKIDSFWLHLYQSSCNRLISFLMEIVDERIFKPSKIIHSFL